LATLCSIREHHGDALENLEQARKIAEKERFVNELRRINCLIGVAKGAMNFASFIENALQARSSGF
jgi:hypothetical protein